jgi:hypothetical protein
LLLGIADDLCRVVGDFRELVMGLARVALVLAAVSMVVAGCHVGGVSEGPAPSGGPTGDKGSATTELAELSVAADGAMSGYSRDEFGHGWSTQSDHCDSRVDVLKAEDEVTPPSGCTFTAGRWVSLYDGLTVTSAHDLDIDHLVPLANAWVTGARSWTPTQRAVFANDVSTELIAVSAHSNRSKGDQPPPGYEPPNGAEDCQYAQRWIAVKTKYHLSIESGEHDALGQMLGTC